MGNLGNTLHRIILQPRVLYGMAWLLALTTAGLCLVFAWYSFATSRRNDGNSGHTNIDFGGPWLMGRMLAKGQGYQLYHRNCQREVLREAYPREHEIPADRRKPEEQEHHDANNLMTWFMGQDDAAAAATIASFLTPLAAGDLPGTLVLAAAGQREWTPDRLRRATTPQVGGPLYPPVAGLLMWPLGYLRPLHAYHTFQVVGILLAFLTAWGIRLLADGRIWWPVAITGVLLFPGFFNSLNLGQNSFLTLTVLVWGWVLIARGRPVWGGAVWGLLVFKPVWLAAVLLVPLLSRRGRVCLAMTVSAAILAAATLPLVGWQSWLDWLQIGRDAAGLYDVDENWIFLSRDLLSIPRRWLIDFHQALADRDHLAATLAAWALFLAVLELTVRTAVLRKDQARGVTGPPAAFLFFGAWLSCFHFMYYEVLLTALPVFLLLTEPSRYLQPTFVAVLGPSQLPLRPDMTEYHQPRPARAYPRGWTELPVGSPNLWVLNSLTLSLVALLVVTDYLFPLLGVEVWASGSVFKLWEAAVPQPLRLSTKHAGTPWSTFVVLGLWLWCGWLWLRSPAAPR
jgi:hypothetical protein